LSDNLPVKNLADAGGGADPTVVAGQLLVQNVVRLVLVSQAALEPPAATADLRQIQGGLLELGHGHGDRFEGLEEVLAAAFPSAGLEICEQPGFVAGSDLAHLDTRLKLGGESPNQLPKIDPLLGHEEQDDPLAAEDLLAIDDLHVEPVFGGQV